MFVKETHFKRFIPYVVSLAFFMESLDTTIINTAIPAIANSLSVNPIDLKIALISYLLSLAVFIPISGWIADKWGAKRVLLVAIAIFTVASIWCGFSHNLFELVIARTLQGLGGALMLPVGRLIIVRAYPRHELINTMSQVIIIGAFGIMLGPVLGGFITHYFSWQWIFWINIPVGLLTFLLAYYLLESSHAQKVPPLDTIGFMLFGFSLAGFTLSMSLFSESGEHAKSAGLIFIGSCILLFLYVLHSRRRSHPIVNVALFRYRTFQISVLGNFFSRVGFGGTPFLLPLLFQIGLGYPAQVSGLLIAPIAAGIILLKPFTVRLLKLFGYKKLLIGNTLFVALGLSWFATISSQTSIYIIMFSTFLYGFLIAMQYSGMNSLAYIEISNEQLSAATSMMSTLQQVTQSFGVAMAALLIRYFSSNSSSTSSLTTSVFHHAFIAMSIITLLSMIIFIKLKPHDGDRMIYATQ